MSRTLRLVALSCALAGCQPALLFSDTQYATRCDLEAAPHCTAPVDHDICGFDSAEPCEGATDVRASCSVTESGTARTFSFTVSTTNEGTFSSLTINQAQVLNGSTAISGDMCNVRVVEGPNTYAGVCGSGAPSDSQPCQVTNVQFVREEGVPLVTGNIFCQFLRNTSAPNLQIEVTRTTLTTGGDAASARTMPGSFRLGNCVGLSSI